MKDFQLWKIEEEKFKLFKKIFEHIFLKEKIKKEEIDENLINELNYQRVLPYYYHSCKEKIDDEYLKKRLKAHYFQFLGANDIYRLEVKHVIDKLNKNNIIPVVLKGVSLQDSLYERPELRPSMDLDLLLIDQLCFKRSLEVLNELGYKEIIYRTNIYKERFAKEVVLVPDKNLRLMIEVHHSLRFGLSDRRRKYDALLVGFDKFREQNIENVKYYGLSYEVNYVFLLYHFLVSHVNIKRLIWILDIYLLQKRVDKKKVKEIFELMENELKGIEDYFNSILDGLLTQNLRSGFLIKQDKHDYEIVKMKREFKNIEGLKAKILWILSYLFPSSNFLKKRYNKESKYFLLYLKYIFRLFRRIWNLIKV